MRAQEAVTPLVNTTATSSATFELRGGRYLLEAVATGSSGTVAVNAQGPDGSTFVAVVPAVGSALTAQGTAIYDLPPGQYQLSTTTLTAVTASLTRVPNE